MAARSVTNSMAARRVIGAHPRSPAVGVTSSSACSPEAICRTADHRGVKTGLQWLPRRVGRRTCGTERMVRITGVCLAAS